MIKIGEHTYFALGCRPPQELHEANAVIGKFCSIAGNINFMGNSRHASILNKKIVPNFPFNERWGINEFPEGGTRGPIVIGNDVWLGEDCFIMDGIHIGDGAIIGARAMVTKDVPSYAVVVGCPMVIKGYRFNKEIINKLLEIKWWDWPEFKIRDAIEDFQDAEKFVKKYG